MLLQHILISEPNYGVDFGSIQSGFPLFFRVHCSLNTPAVIHIRIGVFLVPVIFADDKTAVGQPPELIYPVPRARLRVGDVLLQFGDHESAFNDCASTE